MEGVPWVNEWLKRGLVKRVIRVHCLVRKMGMTQDQERTRGLWYGRKRNGEGMHGEGKAERA